jgi:hypothetical protein
MDYAETSEVKPEGQSPEPGESLQVRVRALANFFEEYTVLGLVRRGSWAQKSTLAVRHSPGNSVELVIAHDRLRGTCVHHGLGDAEYGTLLGTAVNEVPGEDDRAGRVSIDTVLTDIAESF